MLLTPKLYNPNPAHPQIELTLIQYTWYYIQELLSTLHYIIISMSDQPKSTYLVTYSRADDTKIEGREHFARVVVDAFNHDGNREKVVHWSCCKEIHANGGHHYHLAIKLNGVYRWKQVKFRVMLKHKIVLHFSNFATGYYDAYKYVRKEDSSYITSPNHPEYAQSPKTKRALQARQDILNEESSASSSSTGASSAPPPKKARKRLSPADLHTLIVENKIKNDTQLCSLATKRMNQGDQSLANYVLSKDEKRRTSLISTVWKMVGAGDVLERENKSRAELLGEFRSGSCRAECNGKWLQQAKQTLELNGIADDDFSGSILELIQKGRGKNRNILLVGNSNCGKTFLLKPLTQIFKCFQTPASSTFNWVGAEKSECVLLNDFRWSERVIPWSDFLNLLEGEVIHIPVPKTHFAEDAVWSADTPIFATSKTKIRKYERGQVDEIETEMMDSRWKVYVFKHQFSKDEMVEVESCPHCFAKLVLQNE